MKQFSNKWKGSKQVRKQRKYRYNAPLHIKQKFMKVNLSKDLRKKYGLRNIQLRKGDQVKVVVGQFKKTLGKVTRIDLKHERVYVEGVEMIKKDGTKRSYPIHPSNLQINDLDLGDKKRKKKLEEIKKVVKKNG